jgi:hypothetical protein
MKDTLEQQIRAEIYRAFAKHNADKRLLATIGSWRDTLEDAEVLDLLKVWNAGNLSEQ